MQIGGMISLRLGVGAALIFGGITAAQAGFFEKLFGVESEPEQPSYYYHQPAPNQGYIDEAPTRRERRSLDLTVRPRPKERNAQRKNDRPGLQRGGLETAGAPSGPINPVGNPEWYLQDATLRAGDIIVLEKEVLVFRGGRMPFSRANFASLSQSDLPKEERNRLAYMTGLKPVLSQRTSLASAGD